MPNPSAGILPYRQKDQQVEILLVHPGGPYWARRDRGAWMIPKGEIGEGEAALDAALREFEEETGFSPQPPFLALSPIRQKGGKIVHAFACAMDVDPEQLKSNTFTMEWPPRSGREQSFPEVDRARWFSLDEARTYMLESQRPLIDQLLDHLS